MDYDPRSNEQLRFKRKLDYPYKFDPTSDPIALEIIGIILVLCCTVVVVWL